MGMLKDGMMQGLRYDQEGRKWLTKTWELKKSPRFKSSLEEARGKITDGDGLTLYLTPAGSMIWRVEYRWQKARKSYTIGPYTGDESGVSLSEAREALVQVRKWLREGKDPSEQKRAASAPKDDVVTFGKVALDWFDRCTKKRAPEYRKQIEARVKNVLLHVRRNRVQPLLARHRAERKAEDRGAGSRAGGRAEAPAGEPRDAGGIEGAPGRSESPVPVLLRRAACGPGKIPGRPWADYQGSAGQGGKTA
ncbi:MAG: DUF4102 domain-containing protein [Desulfovibrio sp.]|nr:DUF4102 domain-containing protein [Desulfovibrio sp.]